MADQKKWFKVWTTLLIDSLSMPVEDIGRFTVLGCLIASRGDNGILVTDRKALHTLLQCKEIPPDFIKNFNIEITEIEGSCNGGLSVTMKNWNKYQVDSTDKIRGDKIRVDKKIEDPALFINKLRENPAYKKIDIDKELAKMDAWFLTPKGKGRKKTKAFIVNWLNKIDVEIDTTIQTNRDNSREKLKRDLKQAYQDREVAQGFRDACAPGDKRLPELIQRIDNLTRKIGVIEKKII